jgi:plastocyanin
VIKVDLDRLRASFGDIVGRYNGEVDQYYPGAKDLPCVAIPSGIPPYYPRGFGACADLDLDFGTSPNIFWSRGQQLVGAGQKSGVYHAFDANTLEKKWTALVGLPSAVGGIVGSASYDGTAITGPITQLGYLWSVNGSDGSYRWFAPVIDVAHYGQPVTSANGVVYTVDLKGFLDAYDAATGIPLLARPMALSAGASPLKPDPILSLGGVSVARNTVYTSVGTIGALNGYIIAYRPGGGPPAQQDPTPPAPTPPGQTPTPTPVPTPGSTPAPGAATNPAVVAIPGTFLTTYATPVTVIPEGGKLSFINLDVAEHDVIAKENGARTDCPAYLKRGSLCPLFWTTLIGLSTTSTPVIGVEDAQAGKTYDFYCTKHPGMFGKLIVVPGG